MFFFRKILTFKQKIQNSFDTILLPSKYSAGFIPETERIAALLKRTGQGSVLFDEFALQ